MQVGRRQGDNEELVEVVLILLEEVNDLSMASGLAFQLWDWPCCTALPSTSRMQLSSEQRGAPLDSRMAGLSVPER